MRRLYTLLSYLAVPCIALASARRAAGGPEAARRWRRERFGHWPARAPGAVWVHAVSVGEVQAAAILIAALRAQDPRLVPVLSCATPTGRARAAALLPDVEAHFAPFDLPGSVRRCLARLRPRLLILMETELWPNLLAEARRCEVPVVMASARVSERTARLYRRLPGLLHDSLAANVWAGAQSEADAGRLRALGVAAERLSVVGNIKFDRTIPAEVGARGAALRAHYAAGRPVWVAGSTHRGEEPVLLEAHRQLRVRHPDALLVLAPRHPQRFEEVAATLAQGGWSLRRRSRERSAPAGGAAGPAVEPAAVLLLDTLGELPDFYACADVAFVGGSLVPIGGHNLLEPAMLGLPVLSGPHQQNSPDIARVLRERGALTIVADAGELARCLAGLLEDPGARRVQGERARAAVDANRGALARLLQLIGSVRAPCGSGVAPPVACQ